MNKLCGHIFNEQFVLIKLIAVIIFRLALYYSDHIHPSLLIMGNGDFFQAPFVIFLTENSITALLVDKILLRLYVVSAFLLWGKESYENTFQLKSTDFVRTLYLLTENSKNEYLQEKNTT